MTGYLRQIRHKNQGKLYSKPSIEKTTIKTTTKNKNQDQDWGWDQDQENDHDWDQYDSQDQANDQDQEQEQESVPKEKQKSRGNSELVIFYTNLLTTFLIRGLGSYGQPEHWHWWKYSCDCISPPHHIKFDAI